MSRYYFINQEININTQQNEINFYYQLSKIYSEKYNGYMCVVNYYNNDLRITNKKIIVLNQKKYLHFINTTPSNKYKLYNTKDIKLFSQITSGDLFAATSELLY